MRYFLVFFILLSQLFILADGKVVRRQLATYKGSLEETAQEAIIIYKDYKDGAIENLIIKIKVEGEDSDFAWVVPFPAPPKIFEEKGILFDELFNYVEYMSAPSYSPAKSADTKSDTANKAGDSVRVISRKTVGSFDTAVVTTEHPDALNSWLKNEGYQELKDQDNVIKSYIDKKYCFACIKVKRDSTTEALHPLRFEFSTGGHDGIYFPMKMTGLQTEPFDINLYIFYQAWLNKNLNKFGYSHHNFKLKYRDRDSSQCVPNAGKTWSTPEEDPLLKRASHTIPILKPFFPNFIRENVFT